MTSEHRSVEDITRDLIDVRAAYEGMMRDGDPNSYDKHAEYDLDDLTHELRACGLKDGVTPVTVDGTRLEIELQPMQYARVRRLP